MLGVFLLYLIDHKTFPVDQGGSLVHRVLATLRMRIRVVICDAKGAQSDGKRQAETGSGKQRREVVSRDGKWQAATKKGGKHA